MLMPLFRSSGPVKWSHLNLSDRSEGGILSRLVKILPKLENLGAFPRPDAVRAKRDLQRGHCDSPRVLAKGQGPGTETVKEWGIIPIHKGGRSCNLFCHETSSYR